MIAEATKRAASYCRRLTKSSGSSFYYAFLFLPPERREALHSVYAYCRVIDDIVDRQGDAADKGRDLDKWRERLQRVFADDEVPGSAQRSGAPFIDDPVAQGLLRARRRFGLRHEDALAVLQGCQMDLDRSRYQSWDELRGYCYQVASAVGLLCIQIFGYSDPAARRYAVDLGLALQLTNIIRDVGEDARRGRIYLPQQELAAFGVPEADLLCGRRTEAVVALLQHQAQRARGLYGSARATLPAADQRSLLPAEIMAETYYALLQRIERRGFDVFPGPIGLPRRQRLAIALGTFCKGLSA